MKKTKNTNLLFFIALSVGLLIHLMFLFVIPFSDDESHYVTVPFRMINGDSLVQHEWHLTQFAALFSYLPVRIWTAIKGSTEGIFVFLRCVYLALHTSVAVVIYRFFRQYGKWAILASMIFYIQITYRIQAISYQSIFVISLLLFTLCLLSIYKKSSAITYIFAGVCFGCCCVCNPLFCVVFVLYLIGCAVWTKREEIRDALVRMKIEKSGKKISKKQKKQQMLEAFPDLENYNCFFNFGAILKFACGIAIVAVIALVFFFSTGGTIESIFDNMENLLGSSEYDVVSQSIFAKFLLTLKFFSLANLHMPWILPIFFAVLFFDKNRKSNSHRFAYLAVLAIWTIIFIVGVMREIEIYLCAISLPFCVISLTCYILTEKKNKPLFNCMFAPCLISSFFHYLAADTHLGAIGVVLAISNVAGVFFAMDLYRETRLALSENTEANSEKSAGWCRKAIVVGFCLQILFYGIFYQYGQIYGKDAPKATVGPYKGLYMSQDQYNRYNAFIKDLDIIKETAKDSDPVLFDSYNNWMYLYAERPMATYTTWYRGSLNFELLKAYYKENPEKIPKYIYIDAPGFSEQSIQYNIDLLDDMFELTRQDLSNGVLLTVKKARISKY